MSDHRFHEHTLSNGLKLLVEPVSGVRSASLTLLVRGGVAHESVALPGLANMAVAMCSRGAGPYSSHELVQRQDRLGLLRSENAELEHAAFTVSTVSRHIKSALELTAEVVRHPHLPEDQLDLCRAGIVQEIEAIEDDPAQKVFVLLRERALPDPLGRPILGTLEGVREIDIDALRLFHSRHYGPSEAILGVAGGVDFAEIKDAAEEYFGDWAPAAPSTPRVQGESTPPQREHIVSDKVQTHIGVAFDSVRYDDPDYFQAHGAVEVLSGGMSSRLWTEIREKRGLCYSVSASYLPLKQTGVVLAHAATTSTERAAETLELMLHEIRRLRDGIGEDEVARVRAGLKSSLVMQQESTGARASMLARHWYHLGRIRTIEEVAREIDRLSPGRILDYLERRPLRELGIVTLGPEQVEVLA